MKLWSERRDATPGTRAKTRFVIKPRFASVFFLTQRRAERTARRSEQRKARIRKEKKVQLIPRRDFSFRTQRKPSNNRERHSLPLILNESGETLSRRTGERWGPLWGRGRRRKNDNPSSRNSQKRFDSHTLDPGPFLLRSDSRCSPVPGSLLLFAVLFSSLPPLSSCPFILLLLVLLLLLFLLLLPTEIALRCSFSTSCPRHAASHAGIQDGRSASQTKANTLS